MHWMGEIEVVFGLWAAALIAAMGVAVSWPVAVGYLDTRNFTEPLFVTAIMVVAASRPILVGVDALAQGMSTLLPFKRDIALFFVVLSVVPLMGSLITEPAAMTMAALAVLINAAVLTFCVRNTFGAGADAGPVCQQNVVRSRHTPRVVIVVHICFLVGIVLNAHHPAVFVGLLLLFIGYAQAYPTHQDRLMIKEALLVGFFLAGLVILGGLQRWWLQDLLGGLSPSLLFWGSMALTALTDNAALTYLGALVEGTSDAWRYMLVAGAVTGGGLTVIANAPNPAAFAILKNSFARRHIAPLHLFGCALAPTLVAAAMFLLGT